MNKRTQTSCVLPFLSRVHGQIPRFAGLLDLVCLSVPRAVALTALSICAQVAIRPAGPASARGPLAACSAGRQRTFFSLSRPWKEPYVAFASRTAKPGSTWVAQESADVSRGWERLFKAFSTGLHWILGVQGDCCATFDSYML